MRLVRFRSARTPKKRLPKSLNDRILHTANDFASNTTIHGFSYVSNKEQSRTGRVFWMVVVILAISFTTYQMVSLYNQWETSPVITTLDTVALPLEEIEFPAVTICPQGSVLDITDAVLFQQFKEYVRNKTGIRRPLRPKRSSLEEPAWNLNNSQMETLVKGFFRDVYPGAEEKPTKLVTLLYSDNPQEIIENQAVVLPIEEQVCDETANNAIFNELNKQLSGDYCPAGFTLVNGFGCLMPVLESQMTYEDASDYCNGIEGSEILTLKNSGLNNNYLEDIEMLEEHKMLGKVSLIQSTVWHKLACCI